MEQTTLKFIDDGSNNAKRNGEVLSKCRCVRVSYKVEEGSRRVLVWALHEMFVLLFTWIELM